VADGRCAHLALCAAAERQVPRRHPFTADDVVFSIERALAKTSQRAFQLRGVTGARRVDELTVDVLLSAPDAVLPEKMISSAS